MHEMDEKWMRRAIRLAQEAEVDGEVPVGAIIISQEGSVLAEASNSTITNSDPTGHAEILALRTAGARIGNYRLPGATIYCTLEPCAMCAGALVNARVSRLVFGAFDERFGAAVTHFGICTSETLNHRIEITSGVLAKECAGILQTFFQQRRQKDNPAAT